MSYDLKQDQTDLGLNRTDLQSIGGKAYLLAKQRHPHLGPITRQWAATTKAQFTAEIKHFVVLFHTCSEKLVKYIQQAKMGSTCEIFSLNKYFHVEPFLGNLCYINSQVSRCFTARGV